MAKYVVCVHLWQCLCKSALTLPQTVPLLDGNAETDTQFIFGSVTVCQWPQIHRKGRLWDTNRPWFVPTFFTLFVHSPSPSSSFTCLLCDLLPCTNILFHSFEIVLHSSFLHVMTHFFSSRETLTKPLSSKLNWLHQQVTVLGRSFWWHYVLFLSFLFIIQLN